MCPSSLAARLPVPLPERPFAAEPDLEPRARIAGARARDRTIPAPPAYASRRDRASAPLAPSPEYIFVRRDGTVFFAVAYSWSNGSLQYITQEGLRRVIPLTTLDLDATSQFNEQRGLSFRSPA